MGNIFFISDTHFGHKNLIQFKRKDESKLRPFTDVDEMNNALIKAWNEKVTEADKIYHLGDLALQVKNLDFMKQLKGKKILIKGNHDKLDLSQYAKHFKDIRGVDFRYDLGFLLSHVPLHSNHLRRGVLNLHGHLHDGEVTTLDFGREIVDSRYFNVSVERINYAPIEIEELKEKIHARFN